MTSIDHPIFPDATRSIDANLHQMAEILNITTTGGERIEHTLADVLAALNDPRELLEGLGAVLEANVERRFDTKSDPAGQPWQPLALSTQALYNRRDTVRSGPNAGDVVRAGSLLERTRQMRSSLSTQVGADQVSVTMSRRTPGGKWQVPMLHELGTRNMPRRGLFTADPDTGELGADDQADLDAEIVSYLDDLFGPT